jgi:hypothetical protein
MSDDLQARELMAIVEEAGNPTADMEEIGARLQVLYDANQDEGQRAMIEQVWASATKVHEAALKAFEMVLAARSIARQAALQRDQAISELTAVEDALDDPYSWPLHPAVQDAIDIIRDSETQSAMDFFEERMEEWKEEHRDVIEQDMIDYAEESVLDQLDEDIATTLDVSSFEARDIVDILRGVGYSAMNDDEARELIALINRIEARNQREALKRRGGSAA